MLSTAAQGLRDTARTAMLTGLTMAIADPDKDGQATGGLMKLSRPGRNGLNGMITAEADGVIKYGRDTLGKVDKYVDDQFGDPSAAATISRWAGTTQMRTVDNVTDELVVYHNAEDSKDVSYMKYFARTPADYNVNAKPAIVSFITDGSRNNMGVAIETANGQYDAGLVNEGRLTFGAAAVSEDEAGLFDAAPFRFATGEVRTATVPGRDNAVTDAKENERAGTFAGIPGTFICTGGQTACTATSDTKGNLASLSDNWVFQPTAAGASGKVADVELDVDYLSFGYWFQTTTASDGTKTYGVNPFYKGSQPYNEVSLSGSNVTGTATYNGKATGMYSLKTFGSGSATVSDAGQFTADARLTASFGGDDVAANKKYTIEGNITDFRDADGGQISGGGWNVELMKASIASNGAIGSAGDASAQTTGGGEWNGMLYGNPGLSAEDATRAYPTGVAGEFNAHLGNGHVIGAFGATR